GFRGSASHRTAGRARSFGCVEANGMMLDRSDPLRKALTHGLLLWAIVAPLWILVTSALGGRFALDFRNAFVPAAHAVLHGASPYSAVGSRAVAEGTAFLYPPLS